MIEGLNFSSDVEYNSKSDETVYFDQKTNMNFDQQCGISILINTNSIFLIKVLYWYSDQNST